MHIFGYPADTPALERHGLPIVEDACEALGAVHADGVRVGGRGHPAAFGFYANKQLTTGEGGMLTTGGAEIKARVDSERNQGRAPDMGWLDHDRLGFNYRLTDIACALGLAQLRAPRRDARRPRAGRRVVPRGAGRVRGARAALRGRRRRRPRLVRVRRPAPARRRPRRDDPRAGCERGVQSKPYLPAIHLMSFYRETFGHREGEFPVCEDVAARSVALPFFPEITEGQVARGRRGARERPLHRHQVADEPGAAERARRARRRRRGGSRARRSRRPRTARAASEFCRPVSSASRASPVRSRLRRASSSSRRAIPRRRQPAATASAST